MAQLHLGCVDADGPRSCVDLLHLSWMRMEVFECGVG